MNVWRAIGVAIGIGPSLLSAQNSIFAGTVARDSLRHMLGSAEVRFPDLERSASTSAGGGFRLEGLPSGRYVVTIRSVGFAPVTDTVSLAAGATTTHDFVLLPAVIALDTVRSRAQAKAIHLGRAERLRGAPNVGAWGPVRDRQRVSEK